MRTLTTRPVSQRWLVLLVLVVLELGLARVAWAQRRQERVLVLYSTRRDAQVVLVGERELPRVLDPTAADGLDYYSEVIDRARFPDPEYQQAFREFLERKYRGKRFDVIIAMAGHRHGVPGRQPERPVSRGAGRVLFQFADADTDSELDRVSSAA